MSDDEPLPRVLFVCGGTNVYGFERVILRYMGGLHDRGFPLHATVNGWNDGVFPQELQSIGVPHDLIKVGWLYFSRPAWTLDTLRNYPRGVGAFRRVVRKFRPDVVIHSGYRTVAALAWTLGGNNVVAVQEYWNRPWEHRLVRLLDRKIRAYIACSDDIARHLRSMGLPAEKIVRIYNPMTFPEQPAADVARDRPFTFGIAGQIIERKGHHVVFDAMARIRREAPEAVFRLKIFGDGNAVYMARLRAQADELGIADLVEWYGYRTSCDDYYPEMDCALVMTIRPDPCPLSAIEPGAYSLPAITSTAGGLAELVRDGVTGYLVPPHDAATLADRMMTFLASPAEARRMGEVAWAENKRRFDEPRVIDELGALLTSIASNEGAALRCSRS